MTTENNNKLLATKIFATICFFALFGLVGCQKEGPAENVGKKIDHASEKIGKKIEDAKESILINTQAAGEYIDDSVITVKVKEAIENDPMFKTSHIEVTTTNGMVTLSGSVDSEQIISRVLELASSQKNVKSVQTTLIVIVNANNVGQ